MLPLLLLACAKGSEVHARFDPDAALKARDFFALPYPTDLRRTASGLDLTGFPNPTRSQLLSDYIIAMRGQPGFGQASALYASFDGPIDPALVTPDSVQVVDLQTAERVPLQTKWFSAATLFVPANTLALLPLFGTPLNAGHRYALVITEAVHARAAPAMADALRGAGPAAEVTAPFRAFAAAHSGYDKVALASVFTVQDPTETLVKLRAAVRATPDPAPGSPAPHRAGTNSAPASSRCRTSSPAWRRISRRVARWSSTPTARRSCSEPSRCASP